MELVCYVSIALSKCIYVRFSDVEINQKHSFPKFVPPKKMSDRKFFITTAMNGKRLIPEGLSLGKYFLNELRKRDPSEVLYVDSVTKQVLTRKNVLEASIKAVSLFKILGLRKGDVISIICENIIGYIVPIVAALCLGVTTNLLNPGYTIRELRHALLISKPKVVLFSINVYENLKIFEAEVDFVKTILLMENNREHVDNVAVVSFEESLEDLLLKSDYEPDDLDTSETGALIMLSSGTTGLPKGVLISQNSLSIALGDCTEPSGFGITDGDTLITMMPFYHVYGLGLVLCSIFVSIKSIVMAQFNADLYLKTIEDYKVNKLQLVPSLAIFLAKSDIVKKYDLSSLKAITSGASPLRNEIQEELIKRIGNVQIGQVYGSTETSGLCTCFINNRDKDSRIGKLMSDMTAKVWIADSERTGQPMEVGELCFKGPKIMKGYVGVPTDSSVIDQDGFYHSGDVGYYDEDGFFYLVDRMKELIKYRGYQVSPVELEVLLLTHSAVRDCGVVGKPDYRDGQLPFAFVVRQVDIEVTEQELVDYVAERSSSNKRLYGGVKFVDHIPRNSTGKVLRKALEAWLNK